MRQLVFATFLLVSLTSCGRDQVSRPQFSETSIGTPTNPRSSETIRTTQSTKGNNGVGVGPDSSARPKSAATDTEVWKKVGLAGKKLELVDPFVVEIFVFTREGDVIATLGTQEAVIGPIFSWEIKNGALLISSEKSPGPVFEFYSPQIAGHEASIIGQTLKVQNKNGRPLVYNAIKCCAISLVGAL